MSLLAGFLFPHQVGLLVRQTDGTLAKTLAAYREAGESIARLKPDTIILVSPHMESYRDYIQIADGEVGNGRLGFSGRGEYKFRVVYDRPLAREIASFCSSSSFPAGMESEKDSDLDHGTMVPLFFLNRSYSSFKLVRIGISGLSLFDHYRMGEIIASAVESLGRRAVIIASGDLSHTYELEGYASLAERYDSSLLAYLGKGNFGGLLNFSRRNLRTSGECAHRPLLVLGGAFDRQDVDSRLLSREVVNGVGLAVMAFYPRGRNPSRAYLDLYQTKERIRVQGIRETSDQHAKLAYRAIEYFLKEHGRLPIPQGLPPAFYRRSGGVFVSLFKYGNPRGCLGTCFAREGNLANEIVSSAIAACTGDPRYSDLTIDEWPYVEVRIDVLSRPEKISGMAGLNPKKYGVIVEAGEKRGMLLPSLDGVIDSQEQLGIAIKKARLQNGEQYALFRFSTTTHR